MNTEIEVYSLFGEQVNASMFLSQMQTTDSSEKQFVKMISLFGMFFLIFKPLFLYLHQFQCFSCFQDLRCNFTYQIPQIGLNTKKSIFIPFLYHYFHLWRQSESIIINIKYTRNLHGTYKLQRIINQRQKTMVKKVQRRIKKVRRIVRVSEMERTIEEGRMFVEAFNRRRRTVRATRTMAQIARITPKKASKTKKIVAAKGKRIIRSVMPVKKAVASKSARKALVPKPVVLPIPPVAPVVPPVTGVMKTQSRRSIKATKLKPSLRDDMPVPAFGFIDVCFCLDATGSMCGEIAAAQSVIEHIIHNIENKVKTQGLQLRFAVVSYRDHPPQDHSYVTKINDFTDNFETITYVKTLSASGGGDQPQAAHDALLDAATKLNWVQLPGTPVLRYIFHILDAPPHGKQFGNPEGQEGCLCGIQTDDVIREINKKQIHYRMIKARANPKVDTMQSIFQKKIGDYDSTDLQHAGQMNVKVSDMIIHEVLPDYA